MKFRSVLLCCIILAAACSPALAQMGWCWGLDYFRTSVAEGVISIVHESALYNCCPDRFDYSISQEGTSISVVETEVVTIPCACMCCYAIPVSVGPVQPGQYQIDFSWHDETGLRHTLLDVTVPEWGGRGRFAAMDLQVDPPPCQNEAPVAPVPDADGQGPSIALAPEITACYPNPARQGVTISYSLPEDGPVDLAIFGPGGTRIRSLFSGTSRQGANAAFWDGADDAGNAVAAGLYFCRLGAGNGSSRSRLIIVH